MRISDRIESTIDRWSEKWKDQLHGWMVSWVMRGVKSFLEDIEPDSIEQTRDLIKKIKANPATPEMVKAWLDRYEAGGFNPLLIIGIMMIVAQLIQMVQTLWAPALKQMSYAEEQAAKTARLDPISVITAWRRDPEKYAKWFQDLSDLGFSDERQEALKFATQAYPSLRDVIGFYAHEVFEPDMIERYGLRDELPPYQGTLFEKLGVSPEVAAQYWMDHWLHASWEQVMEMLHRGEMTEEDVWDWFRVKEIPPFWRQKLIDTSWSVPNRIEIRMMARYLDLPKEQVMELLKKAGLHEDYRSDAADFMIIMGLTGYWSSMLSKGWMTPDEVKRDIDGRGFRPVTAERIYKTLVKATSGERVEEGRSFTKTEIYKGVKNGVITPEEGIELIMDLGYTRDEADYLLVINVGVLTGSPESYAEFKDITTRYKLAIGAEAKAMPEEILKLGKEVVRLTREVESLQTGIKEEQDKLLDTEELPAEATKKRDELQVALNRAQAELTRVKTNYNIKVAEWRRKV